jgi:hypothetical protein
MAVDETRQNQQVSQVDSFVGAGHLALFAYLEDFAVFNRYVAVDHFPVQVRFGVFQH